MRTGKMWNRADVCAEIQRIIASTYDARRTLSDAARKIETLGRETGFAAEATAALKCSQDHATVTHVVDKDGK